MPKKSYSDLLPEKPSITREEKIGMNKQKMTESDRRSLQDQIAESEANIESAAELRTGPDTSNDRRQIEHKKALLAHDEDLEARGAQKDRMFKRVREIESIIIAKMPSKAEMWPKPGSIEAARAVQHNLRFQRENNHLVREWQNLKLKLEPEDPYAQSLELIRPER